MSKPRPIRVRTTGAHVTLEIVGYRDSASQPYIIVEKPDDVWLGYIEDRDIKRLKAWCEDCLRKRK